MIFICDPRLVIISFSTSTTCQLIVLHSLNCYVMQNIDRMYASFTGQPLEKVQQYTERDRFLSVSEVMLLALSSPFSLYYTNY